jgi:pyrroloquinoline quinone biosynthesis protein D
MTSEASIPAFVRGARMHHDSVRAQWVVLAPEKAFLPDEIAVAALRLIDGVTPLFRIIDALAVHCAAPRDVIAEDVLARVNDLNLRRVVTI